MLFKNPLATHIYLENCVFMSPFMDCTIYFGVEFLCFFLYGLDINSVQYVVDKCFFFPFCKLSFFSFVVCMCAQVYVSYEKKKEKILREGEGKEGSGWIHVT